METHRAFVSVQVQDDAVFVLPDLGRHLEQLEDDRLGLRRRIEWTVPRAQTKQRIMAQCLAIITVLVARGDLEQALRDHLAGSVFDIARVAAIIQCCGQPRSQPDLPVHASKQQRPKVGR